MAFMNKVGNILKQSVGKYANSGLSASNSSIFQSIRCMSSSKLFVGGLSYGTDDTSLREAFASYGEVIEARVIMDRETGRSRGFGFVSFTSGEEASSAIQAMDGQDLHGRRVRVNYATDRAGGFRSGGGGYDGGGGYGGGGYGGGGYSGGGGGYGGGGYGGAGGGGYGGAGGGGSYGSDSYGSGGGSGYNNSPGFGGGGYGTGSSGGNYGVSGGGGGGDNYVSGGADNSAFATGGSYGGGSGSGGGGFGGSSDMSGGYGGSTGAPVQGNNQDDLSGELGGNDLDAATKSSFRDDDNDDEPNDYANKRA